MKWNINNTLYIVSYFIQQHLFHYFFFIEATILEI